MEWEPGPRSIGAPRYGELHEMFLVGTGYHQTKPELRIHCEVEISILERFVTLLKPAIHER